GEDEDTDEPEHDWHDAPPSGEARRLHPGRIAAPPSSFIIPLPGPAWRAPPAHGTPRARSAEREIDLSRRALDAGPQDAGVVVTGGPSAGPGGTARPTPRRPELPAVLGRPAMVLPGGRLSLLPTTPPSRIPVRRPLVAPVAPGRGRHAV